MNQTVLNQARRDKFILLLDLPSALKDLSDPILAKKYSADQIQFMVYGSPVPKIDIPSIDLKFGGQSMKVSSYARTSYPILSLNFIIDNGYQNYWILWKWLNLFNHYENSSSEITINNASYFDKTEDNIKLKNLLSKYCTTFTLFGLDEYNNKIISFKYTDVFITSLNEINYSHQDPALVTSSVSFAYNQLFVDLLENINSQLC